MMIQFNVLYNCKNSILQKTSIYSGPDSVQKGKVKYFFIKREQRNIQKTDGRNESDSLSKNLCRCSHSMWNHTLKNESNPIVFILSTQSVHPMRVHNPEYQSPVTSGFRVTGCANFVN